MNRNYCSRFDGYVLLNKLLSHYLAALIQNDVISIFGNILPNIDTMQSNKCLPNLVKLHSILRQLIPKLVTAGSLHKLVTASSLHELVMFSTDNHVIYFPNP